MLLTVFFGTSTLFAADAATSKDDEEGFVAIFDGKTLEGWTGAADNYVAEEGMIQSLPKKGGNLYTTKDFGDFVLRFEFRLTPGANNGIGIRVPEGGHASTAGMEIQVLDDSAEKYAKIKPWQHHGSVYGIISAKQGSLKPVGEWNTEEISCVGNKIKITVNGEVIVDGDLEEAAKEGTLDGKKHPGLEQTTGRISFCGHGSEVHYRNLRVREVKEESEK